MQLLRNLRVTGNRIRTAAEYFAAPRNLSRDSDAAVARCDLDGWPPEVFKVADGVSDQPTCDLLTQRMQVHEKTAWMLRSLLE